jgi:hypothetical protein
MPQIGKKDPTKETNSRYFHITLTQHRMQEGKQ